MESQRELMENIEHIPINIWDDYWEDGYVPDGEIQETYAYVEDTGIPMDIRKQCIEKLHTYITSNLNTDGVTMWIELYESRKKYPNLIGTDAEKLFFDRRELRIQNLSHDRRFEWLSKLQDCNLEYDNIPLSIYSES